MPLAGCVHLSGFRPSFQLEHQSAWKFRKEPAVKEKTSYQKPALIISAFLLLLCLASLLFLLHGRKGGHYAADIFQDGKLLQSIYLDDIRESRRFTITGGSGCVNEIEVRPGSIAIVSADCPDKLCVHQGFISDSRLPITCLPNRLVIQLRPVSDSPGASAAPDAVTY